MSTEMEACFVGEDAALSLNWLKSHFTGSKNLLIFLGGFFGLKPILY